MAGRKPLGGRKRRGLEALRSQRLSALGWAWSGGLVVFGLKLGLRPLPVLFGATRVLSLGNLVRALANLFFARLRPAIGPFTHRSALLLSCVDFGVALTPGRRRATVRS